MVTACNNSSCPVLLVLSTRQSYSWLLNPVLRHCVQYVLSCLTVFRRLLLCPINHHLVISGFSAIPALSQTLLALARATIFSFFLSLFGYRVTSACLFSELLSLLRASVNPGSTGPLEPQSVLEPRRVRPGLPLALSSRVLSASLEAVSAIASCLLQFLSTLG